MTDSSFARRPSGKIVKFSPKVFQIIRCFTRCAAHARSGGSKSWIPLRNDSQFQSDIQHTRCSIQSAITASKKCAPCRTTSRHVILFGHSINANDKLKQRGTSRKKTPREYTRQTGLLHKTITMCAARFLQIAAASLSIHLAADDTPTRIHHWSCRMCPRCK